jgi:hypothetical protein
MPPQKVFAGQTPGQGWSGVQTVVQSSTQVDAPLPDGWQPEPPGHAPQTLAVWQKPWASH